MYIILRLKAPLQSWGNDTNHKTIGRNKGTFTFPSYSGIFGLLCACNGINKSRNYDKYLELYNSIKYISSFSIKDFDLLEDYQSIGGGYDKEDDFEKNMTPKSVNNNDQKTQLTTKEYLEDADFCIIIEFNNADKINEFINNMQNPIWMPYFGRACCIPSTKLYSKSFDSYEKCIEYIKKDIFKIDNLIVYTSIRPEGNKYQTLQVEDLPSIDENNKFEYHSRNIYKTMI